MATILEFRVTEYDGARKGVPIEGALGEIIIFPGVRIERHGTPGPTLATSDGELSAEARTKSRI
ncbi:hypothetical protein AUC68_08160 [Methyloceanibacter methanicus]|uniref:Uncharacterized protein n=1 Tax=Methyloceanibacter methanicus TaxID=1774968 RepID=A0A1E3VZT0_9HYPH|nr:hypothetical protein [Methyloceanibacter methanicus]ODR98406.1 hypothetical protein AUC68_08160 [Methyloceanibacter methanicus]